jgi:DNA-3-methyladenine glycosylase II
VLAVDGKPIEIGVRQEGSEGDPRLEVVARGETIASAAKSTREVLVQRMLGTESDLSGFYDLIRGDRHLEPLGQRFLGLKPPRFPSLFEAIVNGIACQQLTLTVGILLLSRLAAACGLARKTEGEIAHSFPLPRDLAGMDIAALRRLGFSRQKALALIELGQVFAAKEKELEGLGAANDETALVRLEQLRGVGRWTAEYALLRGLGRLHMFPGDDVGGRNKLKRLLGVKRPLDYEGTQRILSRWRPYGGLVYLHLLLDGLAEKGYLS